jgi:hypothetical protein
VPRQTVAWGQGGRQWSGFWKPQLARVDGGRQHVIGKYTLNGTQISRKLNTTASPSHQERGAGDLQHIGAAGFQRHLAVCPRFPAGLIFHHHVVCRVGAACAGGVTGQTDHLWHVSQQQILVAENAQLQQNSLGSRASYSRISPDANKTSFAKSSLESIVPGASPVHTGGQCRAHSARSRP